MEPIATLPFIDLDSGDEAHVIVRAGQDAIALALTLRSNGDLEVVMPAAACEQLVNALQKAISTAGA